MKAVSVVPVVFAVATIASAAFAASPPEPPMNNFESAYYTCDGGGSFQVEYDSGTPKSAKMTTSDQDKQYDLTRKTVSEGVKFSNSAVNFWTDGKKVLVGGTSIPLKDCTLKAN